MDFMTIEEEVQIEIIEKKSKFIASLKRVETTKEAEEKIKQISKKYYDARHHCVAYRIVEENQIVEKSNDDGEPSGTAGAPMLAILQKNNLANILVVVTRYFGGTLLGTGGLVRAYSDSLLKAIQESKIIQKCPGIEMEINLAYTDLDAFRYYCKNNHILITDTQYRQDVVCKIEMEDAKKEKLLADFKTKKVILKNVKELAKKYITKSI